jgi:surfeit locus 1 family protein
MQTLEGRIAPPPSKLYEPGTPAITPIRQNLDLEQFRSQTGLALLPVMLIQTGQPSEGLLRDWPPISLGIEKHYGYALQWFAMAALVVALYCWFQILKPRLQRTKDSSTHV